MIRSSKHITKFSNTGKLKTLSSFISEYRRASSIILDDIWENGYSWTVNGKDYSFSVKEKKLNVPKYIDYKHFTFQTSLSARALSHIVVQLSGIIKAEVEKQRKRIFMLEKLKSEGRSKKSMKPLIKKIKQNNPVKPSLDKIKPELSSKCISFLERDCKHFDGFLHLKSIFKDKREVVIPLKHTKHSLSLKERGVMMTSFLVDRDSIDVRWKIQDVSKKTEGIIVGADQGLKDILTTSDKQQLPNKCHHGHSLESILSKMTRKKKGSKAFKRAQDHRKNHINWSINQLNVSNIKELRLERIFNIGYKTRRSRILSHWTNTLIRDKVERICEENGVHLIHQSSTYRSQRCSGCGIVRKANRKGKIYACKHCNLELDADYNASLNHEANLPDIPDAFRKAKINRGNGFYWLETGFFDFSTGRSLESLPLVEVKIL